MGPDPDSNRISPGRIVIAIVILIVGYLLIVKPLLKGDGSSGGLLSSNNCSTKLQNPVPKDSFRGLSVTMNANRCSGTSDDTGKAKPYVQALVMVNGSTNDKSVVHGLQAVIHVYRQSTGGKWVRVKQADTPVGTGLQGKGTSSVAYETDRRWRLGHVTTKVNVFLKLTTSKGDPVSLRHTFILP